MLLICKGGPPPKIKTKHCVPTLLSPMGGTARGEAGAGSWWRLRDPAAVPTAPLGGSGTVKTPEVSFWTPSFWDLCLPHAVSLDCLARCLRSLTKAWASLSPFLDSSSRRISSPEAQEGTDMRGGLRGLSGAGVGCGAPYRWVWGG